VTEWLVRWSDRAPERTFLAERHKEGWRKLSTARPRPGRRVAQALLERGLGPDKPVAILSDNSIDHAVLALGAMHVGIPPRPSRRRTRDVEGLRQAEVHLRLVKPGLVFAADAQRFGPALEAVGAKSVPVAELVETNPGSLPSVPSCSSSPRRWRRSCSPRARRHPKGRDQHARHAVRQPADAGAGLAAGGGAPPVIVDWLPWNHTFGGNHNFNMVLRNGGTLYIDGGKPVPELVENTVKPEGSRPTMYFNVPRGYDLLVPSWRRTRAAPEFLQRPGRLFYAAPRCRRTCGTVCKASPRKRTTASSRCFPPGARPRPRRSPPRCISRWSAPA
jgi:feruloyl-CoA synthase